MVAAPGLFFGRSNGMTNDKIEEQEAEALALQDQLFVDAAKGEKAALGILTNMILFYIGKYPTREVLAAAEMVARLWAKTGDVTGRCTFAGVLMHRADDLAKDDADRASHYRWWGVSEMLDLANDGVVDVDRSLMGHLTVMADEGDEAAAVLLNELSEKFPARVVQAANADVRQFNAMEAAAKA
jgi:hypothetical protein